MLTCPFLQPDAVPTNQTCLNYCYKKTNNNQKRLFGAFLSCLLCILAIRGFSKHQCNFSDLFQKIAEFKHRMMPTKRLDVGVDAVRITREYVQYCASVRGQGLCLHWELHPQALKCIDPGA